MLPMSKAQVQYLDRVARKIRQKTRFAKVVVDGVPCIRYLNGEYPNVIFNRYCVSEGTTIPEDTMNKIKIKLGLGISKGITENSTLESKVPLPLEKAIGVYTLLETASKYNSKVIFTGDGLTSMFPMNFLGGNTDTENTDSPRPISLIPEDTYQNSSIQSIKDLHKGDLMIWDRLGGIFDIEVRFPWLDKTLMDFILKISPLLRKSQMYNGKRINKYIIKKSFDGGNLVSPETLWGDYPILADMVGNS